MVLNLMILLSYNDMDNTYYSRVYAPRILFWIYGDSYTWTLSIIRLLMWINFVFSSLICAFFLLKRGPLLA